MIFLTNCRRLQPIKKPTCGFLNSHSLILVPNISAVDIFIHFQLRFCLSLLALSYLTLT